MEYSIAPETALDNALSFPATFDIAGVLLQVRFVAEAIVSDANLPFPSIRVEARRGRAEREGTTIQCHRVAVFFPA